VTAPAMRMASTEASRGHGRPDPRVAQTKQLVLAAAFAVISESGFAGATVERIAERSGVARSSIYRHWPSPLPTLHMEALAPLQQRPEDISRTGDARHDLLAYLSHVVDRLNDPTYAAVSLALMAVADTDPAYARAHQDLLASRTQILIGLLEDAVASHVLCACTDVQFQARLLLAPLTHVRFVEHRTVDRALAERVLDHVLRGSAPSNAQCSCSRPDKPPTPKAEDP
jgi:Tetracyclin repressor-like, C-terminal domain/Bacterial regulatory proteins, tetR family